MSSVWTLRRVLTLALFLLTCVPFAAAVAERAITLIPEDLYISPDPTSQKLAQVERGREVAIIESSGDFYHVLANTTGEQSVTGWLLARGVVRTSTPNGDRILFGEAADSEAEASRRHGRKGAAQDAMRLYARMAEYFPKSPLAGEAAYRAADIRWQIEREDVMSRPSAKERDPYMREGMNEDYMKEVEKKFPHTKWADLAAFDLIDNKLCGEWKGSSKCPEKESEIYEKYVADHPQSPKAPEALFQAAWRKAALIEIYKTEGEAKKSQESKNKAINLAQRLATQYPESDWGQRGADLLFKLNQNIPTYGNAAE
jgi:outer membrane protein assembly factor BamD (BamD/ComL family)